MANLIKRVMNFVDEVRNLDIKLIERFLNKDDTSKVGGSQDLDKLKRHLRKIAQDYLSMKQLQRHELNQAVTSGANLIEQLQGIDIASAFNVVGSSEEKDELKEIIRMIGSVPSGRKLLKKILTTGVPSKISFDLKFEDEDDRQYRGIFKTSDRSIRILKIDTSLPEMRKESRLRAKIMMATILAHEMQHCIDNSRNKRLLKFASNLDEVVVAIVLGEMSAYSHEDQVANELWYKHRSINKVYIYHHPDDPKDKYRRASGPRDPSFLKYRGRIFVRNVHPRPFENRKENLRKALSGNDPLYKAYMDFAREKIKREIQKHPKSRQRVFSAPTSNFQRNVEDYLKEMEIDMSFLEVMSYVKQSTKLLTYPKSSRVGAEK